MRERKGEREERESDGERERDRVRESSQVRDYQKDAKCFMYFSDRWLRNQQVQTVLWQFLWQSGGVSVCVSVFVYVCVM